MKDDSSVEIALQYNDNYNETIVSFANDVRTPEGGMHEEGFKMDWGLILVQPGNILPDTALIAHAVRHFLAFPLVKGVDFQAGVQKSLMCVRRRAACTRRASSAP